MSRNAILASILIAASSSAWGADLKPGQWEVTMVNTMQGSSQERVEQQCMTAKETEDMLATMRKSLDSSNCTDVQVDRNGDSITSSATCAMGADSMKLEGVTTLHSMEHFTAQNTFKGQREMTMEVEGHWQSAECADS